jgi:hypothetical protein
MVVVSCDLPHLKFPLKIRAYEIEATNVRWLDGCEFPAFGEIQQPTVGNAEFGFGLPE